jgi:hypothetical protein
MGHVLILNLHRENGGGWRHRLAAASVGGGIGWRRYRLAAASVETDTWWTKPAEAG